MDAVLKHLPLTDMRFALQPIWKV